MAETLREAIRNCGYSQPELSRRTGVHTSQLCRFCNGQRDLTLAVVAKLCAELGLELRPARAKKGRGEPGK